MKKLQIFCQFLFMLFAFIIISKEDMFQTETCYAKSASSKKIYITQSKLNLLKGEHKTLKLINTKNAVQWISNNSSVATVSKKGTVTAVSDGSAVITGLLGQKKYTAIVTVVTPTLNTNNISININESVELKINGTSKKPIWKTDNFNIADISQNGQVIAVSPGNTKITAVIGSLNLTCNVTVIRQTINISKNTIRKGDFFQLEISGTKNPIKWQSMDPNIAMVSTDGLVVGVSNGTTTIIGTTDSTQLGCALSVESFSLNQTSMLMNIGQVTLLQVIGSTEPVIWLSSDSKIATVDSYGYVSAVAPGKVNISGIIGNKSYICTVTVNGLTLNYTTSTLCIDESIQLSVNDSSAFVEWHSSNEDVADVENGLVYAYSEGTTEISAIIGNRKLSCIITVTP